MQQAYAAPMMQQPARLTPSRQRLPSNGSACRSGKSVVTSYALNGWYAPQSPDAKAFIEVNKKVNVGDTLRIAEFHENDEPDRS